MTGLHGRLVRLAPLIVAGVAAAACGGPYQLGVDGGALPTVSLAREANVYVDCSRVDGFAYNPHNPCETFLLVQGDTFLLVKDDQFGSTSTLLAAETRELRRSHWRHSSPQLFDYNGATAGRASSSQSWVSPDHRTCAYVTTDRDGVAAETRELFRPLNGGNNPQGLLDFFRAATATRESATLWVRLRPPFRGGHCT